MNVSRKEPRRRSRRPLLAKGQLLEILAHVLEVEAGTGARITRDAQLPEVSTGRLRQVDVAVRSATSGSEFLRIVEVQDRSRRVGAEFVDQVVGKSQALGAHRATIVAAAGFTSGALAKLRASQGGLEGYEMREGRPEEWPSKLALHHVDMNLNTDSGAWSTRIPLQHKVVRDALNKQLLWHLVYGIWADDGLVCWVFRRAGNVDQNRGFWVLGPPGVSFDPGRSRLTVAHTAPGE